MTWFAEVEAPEATAPPDIDAGVIRFPTAANVNAGVPNGNAYNRLHLPLHLEMLKI